jgi:hypothetical protein
MLGGWGIDRLFLMSRVDVNEWLVRHLRSKSKVQEDRIEQLEKALRAANVPDPSAPDENRPKNP